MKKFLAVLICGVIFAASITVFAADPIRLVINGVDVTDDLDVKPQVVDGEPKLPLTALAQIAELLGVEFTWNGDTATLDISMAMNIIEPITFFVSSYRQDSIYIVGEDIPAGRYVITAITTTTTSCNIQLVRDMLDFSLFASLGFGERDVPNFTVDLIEGCEIRLSGLGTVVFTPIISSSLPTLSPYQCIPLSTGQWVVGVDIPAGSYNVVPFSGYVGRFVVRSKIGRYMVDEILGDRQLDRSAKENLQVNLVDEQIIEIVNLSGAYFIAR